MMEAAYGNAGAYPSDDFHAAPAASRATLSATVCMERGESVGAALEGPYTSCGAAIEAADRQASSPFSRCCRSSASSETNRSDAGAHHHRWSTTPDHAAAVAGRIARG